MKVYKEWLADDNKMTQERMTRLAYHGALMIWGHINEITEACPGDQIIKAKEREAWRELQELHQMMLEIEAKANK